MLRMSTFPKIFSCQSTFGLSPYLLARCQSRAGSNQTKAIATKQKMILVRLNKKLGIMRTKGFLLPSRSMSADKTKKEREKRNGVSGQPPEPSKRLRLIKSSPWLWSACCLSSELKPLSVRELKAQFGVLFYSRREASCPRSTPKKRTTVSRLSHTCWLQLSSPPSCKVAFFVSPYSSVSKDNVGELSATPRAGQRRDADGYGRIPEASTSTFDSDLRSIALDRLSRYHISCGEHKQSACDRQLVTLKDKPTSLYWPARVIAKDQQSWWLPLSFYQCWALLPFSWHWHSTLQTG